VVENRTSHQDQNPLINRLSYRRRHIFRPDTAAYLTLVQDSFTPSDKIPSVGRVPEITFPNIDNKAQ